MSEVKVADIKKDQAVVEAPFKADERTPYNWSFDPDSDDDTLIAYNNVTQRSFNGPRESFKALMLGKPVA